ncbi:MAG TPA: DUF1761 domain-containing protein [Xanthobacteraceae bacterium]|nr:DUF1761 domain-containing protein [Xanthobacteraceae bacterium]
MQFAGMNYLAIVAAAIAAYVFSAIYYTALSTPWMKAAELKKGRKPAAPWLPFVIAAVADLVMAWVLAGTIGHLGIGQVTFKNGVISGAFIWFGFVLTTIAVNYGFAGRKPLLTVIDAAHWLCVLLLMGAIIGLFGV